MSFFFFSFPLLTSVGGNKLPLAAIVGGVVAAGGAAVLCTLGYFMLRRKNRYGPPVGGLGQPVLPPHGAAGVGTRMQGMQGVGGAAGGQSWGPGGAQPSAPPLSVPMAWVLFFFVCLFVSCLARARTYTHANTHTHTHTHTIVRVLLL